MIAARLCIGLCLPLVSALAGETRNVILVMADGLRVQEMFGGADESLITVKYTGSLTEVEALQDRYLRDTPEARREALLPFIWQVVAKQGQIYGNRKLGSEALLTNRRNFSYPGYNEILCGFADDRIDSNAKIPNRNVTVLEWLHRKPEYRGRIAAFGSWDVFPYILNTERAGFPVIAGHAPLLELAANPRVELLNRIKAELPEIWASEAFDALTFHTALEYFKERKPRVLFLSFGETDAWGHAGNYKNYLKSAHLFDQYLRTLWETAQSMPEYRGKTTLIVGVDHGRGEADDWKNHGEKIADSKWHWMAFLGPDTKPLGERRNVPAVTQSQVAATLAALLGEDYAGAEPKAGRPIGDVLPH
jgi:hypothetical protein